MNQIRKNKMIVKDNNGNVIQEIDIVGLPLAATIANLADVTDVEVQVLLDTILTDDINGFCCNSPLPIINSINAVGNYTSGVVTFTVDFTNVDNNDYTISVKENGIELLNYAGDITTQTVTGLTFVPRRKRIFEVTVTSTSCSGTSDKIQSFSLGPEGFTYNMGNGNNSVNGQVGSVSKNGTVGGQFFIQTGQTVQLQYYYNSTWTTETKVVTISTNNGQVMTFPGNPLIGIPNNNFVGVPLFGRFRNLTTGGAWEDFGSQISPTYP